jgi:hypothetical protein
MGRGLVVSGDRRGADRTEQPSQWRSMLSVNRASVLIAAALAVASPFVAATLAWAEVDERARGPGYLLLNWPIVLIDHLPNRASSVLMTSGLVPLLLYFGFYLLACHGLRLLWRRWRRVEGPVR